MLGNYSLQGTSPAINHITCSETQGGCEEQIGVSGVNSIVLPATDFFGNPRPDGGTHVDPGAVEVPGH